MSAEALVNDVLPEHCLRKCWHWVIHKDKLHCSTLQELEDKDFIRNCTQVIVNTLPQKKVVSSYSNYGENVYMIQKCLELQKILIL